MPYTTVSPSTTIASAWANANVRDQVITPFATAAARDSAITAPVVGMVCYLTDSNTFWYYRGTAWHYVPGQYLYCMANQTYQQYGANQVSSSRLFYTSPDITMLGGHVFTVDWLFFMTSTTMTLPSRWYSILDVSTNAGSTWNTLGRSGWTEMGATGEWNTGSRFKYMPAGGVTQARFRLTLNITDGTHGFDYGLSLAQSHFSVETTGLLSSEVATS